MVQLYGKDNSFSEYQEPNSWRDEFKPYNDSYYSNTTSPISFTRELPPTDYMAMREKIIQEELDIKKITCPVRNISDPNILYTCSQAEINKLEKEKPKSLFTITQE
jgi:hypothetical protein